MARQPPVRQTEQGHYAFLHRIGVCAATGRQHEPIEVAHLRRGDFRMGTDRNAGMALKPHYRWTLPLASSAHREQEDMGLELWFERIRWPYDNIYWGPLVVSQVIFAFSTVDDLEGAQRYICANVLGRRARAREMVFPTIPDPVEHEDDRIWD